jgi:hypothetical protein
VLRATTLLWGLRPLAVNDFTSTLTSDTSCSLSG